jgi:hydroxymethylpyrimidine/phosphomethylpyrimidine kinase
MPSVLTIAGSDSSAGAGIQADLKTFAALGVYGTSAVTAVTAQNTRGVTAVQEMPPGIIAAQIDAVVADIRPDAVKTGMLASAPIIEVVAGKLKKHGLANVVVDPVMVAKSGDRLLREDAVAALRDLLLPLAAVVTPNLPEAEVLVGRAIASDEDARKAAEEIVGLGAGAAVVKGGHRPYGRPSGREAAEALDILYDGSGYREYSVPRVDTMSTHGTGCTFSSAIAAYLARGEPLAEAVGRAKEYLTEALRRAYPIGGGHGPVHHFHRWWKE